MADQDKCEALKTEGFRFKGTRGLRSINSPSAFTTAYFYVNRKGEYLITLKRCDESHGRMMRKEVAAMIENFDDEVGDIVFPDARKIADLYPSGTMLVSEIIETPEGELEVDYLFPHLELRSPLGALLEQNGRFEFSSLDELVEDVDNSCLSKEEFNAFLFEATDYTMKTLDEIQTVFKQKWEDAPQK